MGSFISCIIITIIIIGLTGCTSKQKSNINEKLDAEISYIEDLIIKIANKYAKSARYLTNIPAAFVSNITTIIPAKTDIKEN